MCAKFETSWLSVDLEDVTASLQGDLGSKSWKHRRYLRDCWKGTAEDLC